MTRTYSSRARDQRIAEDAEVDQSLMCTANGCPNRWCVDAGNGHLCSAHAWSDRHQWPQITQEQLDAQTARALRQAVAQSQPPAQRWTGERKAAVMRRLKAALAACQRDPKAWAKRLKAREEAGEKLGDLQRAAWRAALGEPASENRSETEQEWRDAA